MVGSGAMTISYTYLGLFLYWLALSLMSCRSWVDVMTLILSGDILMIRYRDLTMSRLATMSLNVNFISTPLDRSMVSKLMVLI